MPLPVTIPKNDNGFRGPGMINDRMTQETADTEKLLDPEYLGSGHFGVAVKINNGNVVKYTYHKDDAIKAESLIGNTKYPVVRVFDVLQIQESPPLWAIEMEKVTPYRELDPSLSKWKTIQEQLEIALAPIQLDHDVGFLNVGWNSEGKPVLFDLTSSFAWNE